MKRTISGIIMTLTLLASAAAQAATGAAPGPAATSPAATSATVTKDETVFALLDPTGPAFDPLQPELMFRMPDALFAADLSAMACGRTRACSANSW